MSTDQDGKGAQLHHRLVSVEPRRCASRFHRTVMVDVSGSKLMPPKAKIIIIGTKHSLQCGDEKYTNEQVAIFKSVIVNACDKYEPKLIAEEMNLDGLDNNLATITVASEMCHFSTSIEYRCIDMPLVERAKLKIDIGSLESFAKEREGFHEYTDTQKAIDKLRAAITDPIRECCWLAKIIHINLWPTLLICGDDHVDNMETLIHKVDKRAIVPIYRLDTYHGSAIK